MPVVGKMYEMRIIKLTWHILITDIRQWDPLWFTCLSIQHTGPEPGHIGTIHGHFSQYLTRELLPDEQRSLMNALMLSEMLK